MRLLLSGSKSSSTFCPFLVMPLVQHHKEQNGGANQWGGFPKLSPARNFITARTSTLESPLLAGSPMTIFLAGRGRGRPRRPFQIKSRRRRNNGREKRWAAKREERGVEKKGVSSNLWISAPARALRSFSRIHHSFKMDRGASDGIDLFGEEEDFCIEEGGTEEVRLKQNGV